MSAKANAELKSETTESLVLMVSGSQEGKCSKKDAIMKRDPIIKSTHRYLRHSFGVCPSPYKAYQKCVKCRYLPLSRKSFEECKTLLVLKTILVLK